VLVPDPAWMPHVNVVELLGGRVRRVPGKPENRFWPTLEDWEKQVSPSTVALVINSPNNPTGYVADRDYLSGVAAFASRHGLYILSDEVYHKLLYDGCPHACMASLPGARERTLLINSFSKTYAMTGWRVGFLAGPSRIIGEALKASQYSITNVPPFIQEAAREALVGKEIQGIVRRMLDVYDRRRNLVVSLWGQGSTKARIAIPDGAFYFFLDVRDVGRSSIEVAQDFLSSTGVAMVPGSVYGPSGEGFLRMTIAASDDVVRTGTLSLLAWIAQHIDRSV
jgi:aspartate/methionine/tyrosine aminotransferase